MGRPQVDVTVGEDGSFSTGELSPGAWKVLWQPAAGSATGQREVEIPAMERTEVVLDFPGLMLTGIVLGEDGEPAAGARVREIGSGALAFSATDGSFHLPGPEGATRASVRAESEGLASPEVEVALEPGRVPDPVRLTLERRSPPSIETLVVDSEGLPVAGAFVFLEEEGRGFRILTTGSDGRAAAAMTPPYPARVRLAATSGASWSLGGWVAWDDARSRLTASLGGSGAIEILGDLTGTPRILSPTGWDVAVLLASLGSQPALSPGIPLRVEGLPPGVYTVAVANSHLTVSARAGEVTEAHIVLD